MALNKKEKREIGVVFGSVLLVVLVGGLLHESSVNTQKALSGQATHLVNDAPTYSGFLTLMNEHCSAVYGVGKCSLLCGTKTCVPLENNCNEEVVNNQCWCCQVPNWKFFKLNLNKSYHSWVKND